MRYAIGVGANRGDPRATIAVAEQLLPREIELIASAPLIATEPVGGPRGQPQFLNGAWVVNTALGPHQLLHALQRIESALGRARSVRWGSRMLDLDLLLRDDGWCVASPVLTLPHPLLAERAFVLTPLATIAGEWVHPILGQRIADLALAVRASSSASSAAPVKA